jgi:hypothetical protein
MNYIIKIIISVIVILLVYYLFSLIYKRCHGTLAKYKQKSKIINHFKKEKKTANDFINLALINHHGILNNKGETIMEPNGENAIKYYYEYIKNGGNPEVLFNVIDIYALGIHKFEPDLNKAIEICDYIINNIPELETKGKNKKRYINMVFADELNHKNKGETIIDDNEINDNETNDANRIMDDMLNYDTQFFDTDINNNNRLNDLHEILNNGIGDINGIGRIANYIVGNSQNVHDSTINLTLTKSIDNLQQSTPILINKENGLQQIRNLINQGSTDFNDNDKKTNAIKALDSIEKTFSPASLTGGKNILLTDCLNLVWNRINQYPSEQQKDLKNNLINELSDSVEHNSAVCTHGKLARIVDTLNIVDPEVKILSKNMLNGEIVTKANKIKNDIYQNLDQTEKKAIDNINPNEEEIKINKNYENNVKKAIITEIEKDYSGNWDLMNEVKQNMNTWINNIF